jgi:hypothetical protein
VFGEMNKLTFEETYLSENDSISGDDETYPTQLISCVNPSPTPIDTRKRTNSDEAIQSSSLQISSFLSTFLSSAKKPRIEGAPVKIPMNDDILKLFHSTSKLNRPKQDSDSESSDEEGLNIAEPRPLDSAEVSYVNRDKSYTLMIYNLPYAMTEAQVSSYRYSQLLFDNK